MITKVYDEQGNLLHDCAELNCEVSWDGYAIRAHEVEHPGGAEAGTAPGRVTIAAGDPLPGRADPDPKVWRLGKTQATLRKDR